MKIASHVVPTITVDGETFRDLDRDAVRRQRRDKFLAIGRGLE